MLLLAVGVYFVGPQIYVRYFLEDLNCEPAVNGFTRADTQSIEVSGDLELLYQQDQADRKALGSGITPEELVLRDAQRRHEVLMYLAEPGLYTAEDFYYAAMIFHHGTCSDHFEFAHGLAKVSMDLGNENAKWLFASTLDRYLRKIGEVQRFGTQYDRRGSCAYVLGPVDRTTTDEDRRQYNVPSLAEALALATVLSDQCRE